MKNPNISVTCEMPKYKEPLHKHNVDYFWLAVRRDRNFQLWSCNRNRVADRYFDCARDLKEALEGEELHSAVQIDSLHFAVLTWEEYNKDEGSEWNMVIYAHWANGNCGEFGVPVLNEETGEYEVPCWQEWYGEFTPEDLWVYYDVNLPEAEYTQEDAELAIGKKFKPTPMEESILEERRKTFHFIRS